MRGEGKSRQQERGWLAVPPPPPPRARALDSPRVKNCDGPADVSCFVSLVVDVPCLVLGTRFPFGVFFFISRGHRKPKRGNTDVPM